MSNFSEEAVKSLRQTLNDTPKEVLVSLLENMLAKMDPVPGGIKWVHMMRLCESHMIMLHPNEVYVFTVDPDCARCKKYAGKSGGENVG